MFDSFKGSEREIINLILKKHVRYLDIELRRTKNILNGDPISDQTFVKASMFTRTKYAVDCCQSSLNSLQSKLQQTRVYARKVAL